jgi:ubiquinone/menaquinone biosynthesis C-methylase UbiE
LIIPGVLIHNMNLNELNPDAFSRFALTCAEIKKVANGRTIHILDIGGSSKYLYEFLTANNIKFQLTVVDIVDYEDKPKDVSFILQSAEKLKESDDTYDVVTAIDVLEHIPGAKMKSSIVSEALRVSKDTVIIAGPFKNENVTRYEHMLNDQNTKFFMQGQKWLVEHFEYGKPVHSAIEKIMQQSAHEVYSYTTLPLTDWYVSSLVNLLTSVSKDIPLRKIQQLNTQYNVRFESDDDTIYTTDRESGYRTFLVAKKSATQIQTTITKPKHIKRLVGVETYVDVLAGAVHKNRTGAQLKKDILWHKSENARLTKEVLDLREKVSKHEQSVDRDVPHRINQKVHQLIKGQGKKKK